MKKDNSNTNIQKGQQHNGQSQAKKNNYSNIL